MLFTFVLIYLYTAHTYSCVSTDLIEGIIQRFGTLNLTALHVVGHGHREVVNEWVVWVEASFDSVSASVCLLTFLCESKSICRRV